MRESICDFQTAELRHVAVLFADLQGFTYLCERLDPEEVVDLLNVIYEKLGQEITRYAGHIDKILGDGLMVLFGAPQAHEDDGLRAVMAGLAMQKVLSELQPWIKDKLGHNLGMRIGIDAGPVVYGCLGPASNPEATVVGDAANVAARLQRIAAPGQVVTSDRARGLASRHLQFRKLGEVQLEGRRAAVEAYVAVAPYAPLAGTPAYLSSSFIGRSEQMEKLRSAYRQAAQGRTGLVLLSGEAGIGKSRLLSEFTSILQQPDEVSQPVILNIRNHWEVGQNYRPYEVLISSLGTRTKATAGSRPAIATSEKTVLAAIRAICMRVPVVVIVDDWEWVDPEEEKQMANVIRQCAGLPALFIIAGRRFAPFQEQEFSRTTTTRIRLMPLPSKDAWAILQQHPAFDALPVEAAESLLHRTGGNPAHILESIDSLIEEGFLTASGEGWRAREACECPALPESMRNDILSRLDALDDETRHVIRVAAVVGERVELSLLAGLIGVEEEYIQTHVDALMEAGLMTSVAPETGTYLFRSDLVRSVAYETMLRRQRRELHQKIGRILEESGRSSGTDLAHHFVRAGDATKALLYGVTAARDMLTAGHYEGALQILSDIDKLAEPPSPAQRIEFLELLGEAHVATGNCVQGLDEFVQALGLAREPEVRARLMAQMGWAYSIQGRVEMAVRYYQKAQSLLASFGTSAQEPLIGAAVRLLYDRP